MSARSGLRAAVPWWMRIGAKLMLSRLPVSYSVWKRLRLFEHGAMDQPRHALRTFVEHARTAGLLQDAAPHAAGAACAGLTVLELGPGDSLFTAVLARAMGARETWLVDAGPFATTACDAYLRLAQLLQQEGLAVPWHDVPVSIEQVLERCRAHYLTGGVDSLARIESGSVDYCFSNAVLEHIPRAAFSRLAHELRRVMRPQGVCVHRVDLKDHLGGGLNNLRFSEATWESALFRNAGFYTNRLRFDEIVETFAQAGFQCATPRVLRWDALPLPRERMDAQFAPFSDDALRISGFDLLLRVPEGRS